MISEKVHFQDSNGVGLVGILSRPIDSYAMPVVIACHGFSSSKDGTSYIRLEEGLIKHNIAIFRFDFFGHGESEGNFSEITLSKAIDGTLQAYVLLKALGFKNIAVFGSSFGGCTALNVASKLNEDLACLVCKCPVSDYAKQKQERLGEVGMKEYKEKGYYMYQSGIRGSLRVNYGFYEDMDANNAHNIASSITIPTLIVHGDSDKIVGVEQSYQTAELIPNCKLEVIAGAGHDFSTPSDAYDTIHALFITFLVEKLV